MSFWPVYSLVPLRGLPLNGSWNFLPAQLKYGPTSRSCFWLVSLRTIQRSRCQLSLRPSRGKESPSKPSSSDFRAWHSVVLAAWPSPHWSRHVITIYKLAYSLKWGWQNVKFASNWCYKVNKKKRSSLKLRLRKKTTSQDPTNQCDAHQSRFLNQEEGILWRRKLNHLQRPSQSREVWLLVNHVEINHTPSRMSTWSLYSSYFKRVTCLSFQRSDVPKRWGRRKIPTTIYITGCWDTLPRLLHL